MHSETAQVKLSSQLLLLLCSSEAIMTSGAQHDLLEKLLFSHQVNDCQDSCSLNKAPRNGHICCIKKLNRVLSRAQVILTDLPEEEQEVAKQLTRAGYLVAEPSEAVDDQGAFVVAFVSKLHMEYTRFCFYTRSFNTLAQMPQSMSDFLRLVLQHMSSAQMANSLNTSKSPRRGLLEAHYQNEFYR